ncbi:MAG: DUF4349 domain-containing protein [Ilumatobacteraceae bacterium]
MNTPGRVARVAAALALILLTACGDDSDSKASIEDGRNDAAPADTASASDGDQSISAGEATDSPALVEQPGTSAIPDVITDPTRKLVITMTVGIEVTEAAGAVDEVIALAARHGGQLYDSQLDLNDPKTASGDLVFKLPPDEVQSFLAGLDPGIGRRTGLDGTTSDVTTQIADLDAQILAAEASVDRVRVLLEGAKTLDDVIRLEIEFTSRQTHLEQLRAQQRTLDGLVSLATITVHLTTAPAGAEPTTVENISRTMPDKGVGAAFEKGWDAFLTVLVALALFVGYTAPFLVLGGIALLIVWRVGRRVARNKPVVPSAPQPQSSPVGQTNQPTPVG